MNEQQGSGPVEHGFDRSRRSFLGGALGAAASGPLLAAVTALATSDPAAGAEPNRKIKLGLVGCGGRGSWLAGLFKQDGGYEIHAVADYFQETADRCGDNLGVAQGRRFSGLSGYKRVLESGVEAVALEVPPCFFAEMAAAAVEAGVHVYMAKPVAVDVPGCLHIEAAARQATRKRQAFFVDYQIPTDPSNVEVVRRIHNQAMGKLAKMVTICVSSGYRDPPKTATLESRLRNSVWTRDVAPGRRLDPGLRHSCRRRRPLGGPPASRGGHGNVTHLPQPSARRCPRRLRGPLRVRRWLGAYPRAQSLFNGADTELACYVYGETAHGLITYWQNAHFHRRGEKEYTGQVVDLYTAGAVRNIASFREAVAGGARESPGRAGGGRLPDLHPGARRRQPGIVGSRWTNSSGKTSDLRRTLRG